MMWSYFSVGRCEIASQI